MLTSHQTHRAAIGSRESADYITQCGLARPVRAYKSVDFTSCYFEVDAPQNGNGIALMQSAD